MHKDDTSTNGVKTADTLFDIVEYLYEHGQARVSEIADAHGIAPSTAHRHLSTLLDREYIRKEGDLYRLGLRFLDIGQRARNFYKVYDRAKETTDNLAAETDERVQLLVEEHGYGVYLYVARGERAVRTDPGVGRRVPLHVAAAGKAILAHIPEDTLAQYIEKHEFESHTDTTITDPDRLRRELNEVREQGYAVNDQEFIRGLRAVGVPITTPQDRVIGAISVSGPKHRMKGPRFQNELPDLLLGIATELDIAYS